MEAHVPMPQIDRHRCNRCGRCIAECPTRAAGWVDGWPAILKPLECSYCGLCEELCPTEAISLVFEITIASSERAEAEEP